jgi:hypothetical protein
VKGVDYIEAAKLRHLMYGSAQREGFKELWDTWLQRWGKTTAADALLIAMAEFEQRFQDLERFKEELRKAKRKKR